MTTYLDKETVLKYLTSEGDGKASDYMLPAEYVKTLLEHLEKGEFDATNSIGCEKKCYGNAEEFKALKNSIEEKDAEIARLKSRITELEKLTELQKGTIDAQGKATRANMAKELSAIIQQEWQCSLPEILYIIECVEKGKYGVFSKPTQKEPEYCTHLRWISGIEGDGDYSCALGNKTSEQWCYKKERCSDWKRKEPELNTECLIKDLQDQCAELRSRVYDGMAEDLRGLIPRLDNLESRLALEGKAQQEQNAAISKHTEQIYSLESGIQHHNARLHEIEQRQGRDRAKIMGEIKDQREDYHAHIRQFVEENVAAHKELDARLKFEGKIQGEQNNKIAVLETALKTLQEEVHKIKDNPILITYDPSAAPVQITGYSPNKTTCSK